MSYIEIETGGRKRGLSLTQETRMLLQTTVLMEMDDAERGAFGVLYIFWAGLKTECALNNTRLTKTITGEDGNPLEVGVTFKEVSEWYGELAQDVKSEILKIYLEVNPAVESTATIEEKKSLPDIITEPSVTSSPADA